MLRERRTIGENVSAKYPVLKDLISPAPQGAFYFYSCVKSFLHTRSPSGRVIETDEDLSEFLAEEYHVMVVPGSKFGGHGFVRICFARPPSDITAGFEALAQALLSLQKM